MKGMILAAGHGERMRPLTHRIAKSALPVLNRPLLSYSLQLMSRCGVRNVAVNAHHRPETVEAVVRDWTPKGMKVTVLREEEILGTGGGIRNAASLLRNGPFFLSNGDFILEADPSSILDAHKKSGATATMALFPYQEHSGYTPVWAKDGRIVHIGEGAAAAGAERYVFTGFHVLESSILDRIPESGAPGIVRPVYSDLLAQGENIAAHVLDGGWVEFGNPAEYLRRSLLLLTDDFSSFRESLGIQVEQHPGPVVTGEEVRISPNAGELDQVVLGNRTAVGRDARARHSVFLDDAVLSFGSEVTDCIVGPGVILPPESRFEHRIILSRGDDLAEEPGGKRQENLVHFQL